MRNQVPQLLVCPFLRSASGASARTYLTYDPVETKHPQARKLYHNPPSTRQPRRTVTGMCPLRLTPRGNGVMLNEVKHLGSWEHSFAGAEILRLRLQNDTVFRLRYVE
jgi:hypothetical protein